MGHLAHYTSSCVLPFILFFLLQVQLQYTGVRATFEVGIVCDSFLRYSFLDQQICDGAKWWIYWMNANGGFTYGNVTTDVALTVLDASSPDPKQVTDVVTSAYERLVLEYKVDLLISPSNTIRAAAAIQVAEKYKKIILVVSSSGELPKRTNYSFFHTTPVAKIPLPALQVISETVASDFTILARPDDYSQQMANISNIYLSSSGMRLNKLVTLTETPDPPNSQKLQDDIMNNLMQHLKGHTDVLIFCATSIEIDPLMVAFNDAKLDVNAAVFTGPISAFEQSFRSLGLIGDGWLANTKFSDSFTYGRPGILGGTTAQFMENYVQSMGHPPGYFDPLIAAALMSFVKAANVSGTINSTIVARTMKDMGSVNTFAMPIDYEENGVNTVLVEVAIQNLNGKGKLVGSGNFTYPFPWPWGSPPEKGFDTALIYTIVFPVAIVCIAVTVSALLWARYHRKRAVEAISKAEEGDRKNFKIDFKHISLGTQIGTGSFGNVFRADYHGADVCVKKLKLPKITKQQQNLFAKEAEVMVGLRHPNIVFFMGVCMSSPNYCIVTEYMQRGSLFDVIHNEKINLKVPLVMNMISDILKGLFFIHSAGLIHRDVKSPNLLVDRNWTIKIADFGLTALDTRISLLWTAPEVLLGQKGCYTDKSDIYSFGVVVWELMSRKVPFEGVAVAAISPAVVAGQRPQIPGDWPAGISALITSCWHARPGSRPAVKEARSTVDTLSLAYDFETAQGPPVEPTGSSAPPSGHVTFVCSTVQQLYQPWAEDPWGTAKSIALLNARVLEVLKRFNGHEVRNDGVSFLFAFGASSDAFSFCLNVQTEVMSVPWPESILKFEEAQEVSNAAGEILFKGISLRMGIHTTSAVADKDLATGAINYLGKGINLCSKLAGLAKRGQILIGADSFSRLGAANQSMPQYYMESLGTNALENEISTICLILPFKLKGRLWDQPELQFPPPPESHPTTPSQANSSGTIQPQRISKTMNSPSFYSNSSNNLMAAPMSTLTLLPNTSRSLSGGSVRLVFTGTNAKTSGSSEEGREPFEFPPAVNRWMIEEKELKGGMLLDKSNRPWEVFSSVLRGGEKVVVEKFSNQKLYDGMLLEMRAETAALRRLQHPNVAKYYGICLTSQYLCLVTEFSVSSLSSVLQNPDNYNLPWDKKFQWAVDIAKGMWYLHSNGIIHTDLKSANVVFNSEGVVKIVDYGFNRIKTDTQAMTQAGTVGYVAPEVFQGNGYTEQTDVYSYGIILWELIFQVPPWAGEHSMHIVYKVTSSGRPSVKNLPPQTPAVVSTLMDASWQQNPVLRPGFVDIIAELDPKVLSDM